MKLRRAKTKWKVTRFLLSPEFWELYEASLVVFSILWSKFGLFQRPQCLLKQILTFPVHFWVNSVLRTVPQPLLKQNLRFLKRIWDFELSLLLFEANWAFLFCFQYFLKANFNFPSSFWDKFWFFTVFSVSWSQILDFSAHFQLIFCFSNVFSAFLRQNLSFPAHFEVNVGFSTVFRGFKAYSFAVPTLSEANFAFSGAFWGKFKLSDAFPFCFLSKIHIQSQRAVKKPNFKAKETRENRFPSGRRVEGGKSANWRPNRGKCFRGGTLIGR